MVFDVGQEVRDSHSDTPARRFQRGVDQFGSGFGFVHRGQRCNDRIETVDAPDSKGQLRRICQQRPTPHTGRDPLHSG